MNDERSVTPSHPRPRRRARDTARPLVEASMLALGWVVVATVGFVVTRALAPALAAQTQALCVLIVLSLLVVALLSALRWWTAVGFVAPRHWRNLWVLVLPVAVVLAPALGGVRPDLAAPGVAVLVVGYLLTGFAEEAVFRGAMLRILSPRGIRSAVLVSSLLFALVHLGNVVIRGNPAIVAAQAVGAFTSGIGYAAIFVWTGAIWPAIIIHFLHDLVLNVGNWPVIAVDVVQDVVLVVYGAYLLWFRRPPVAISTGRPVADDAWSTRRRRWWRSRTWPPLRGRWHHTLGEAPAETDPATAASARPSTWPSRTRDG